MEGLYVAQLGTNNTYNVNFRVGFFGKPNKGTQGHVGTR